MWLMASLGCLSAWLTFLHILFISLCLLPVNMLFSAEDLTGTQGIAALIVIAGLSIVTAGFVTRWQHRVLARRSRGTNYIVLAILILLTLLFLPTLFVYPIK
jgi:hypothetical protein